MGLVESWIVLIRTSQYWTVHLSRLVNCQMDLNVGILTDMTHNQLLTRLHHRTGVKFETLAKIVSDYVEEITTVVSEGDEVKVHKLGTFYPNVYKAREGQLEFGGVGSGEKRRRMRFRPIDTVNARLTKNWKEQK